jgi:hypothetical protein
MAGGLGRRGARLLAGTAAAALVVASRRRSRRVGQARGLAAFEDAPCFREEHGRPRAPASAPAPPERPA